MSLTVVDNTVLSNYSIVGQRDLILAAFPDTACPPGVWNEYQRGIARGYFRIRREWGAIPILALTPEERALSNTLAQGYGRGEAECIALAETRGADVLTDDRAARRRALITGVEVSGTLGVLVTLLDAGAMKLGDADRLLQQMTAAGYHSPVDTLRDLLG